MAVVLAEEDLVVRAPEDAKNAAPCAGDERGGRRRNRLTRQTGAIGRCALGGRLQAEQRADDRVTSLHRRCYPCWRLLLEEGPREGVDVREPYRIDAGAKGVGVGRERVDLREGGDEGPAGQLHLLDREVSADHLVTAKFPAAAITRREVLVTPSGAGTWNRASTAQPRGGSADGRTMTASTPRGDSRSGPTLSVLTGAIILREGAGAVGSTFARQWDPEAAPRLPEPTPSSLSGLPPLPPPSLPAAASPVVVRPPPRGPARRSRRVATPIRARSSPWSLAGAFALGATLAALAGMGVDRGSLGFAALSSAVAGGVTLATGLAQIHANAKYAAEKRAHKRRRGGGKAHAVRGDRGRE